MSGAISLGVHGCAETDAQETDNTTDDGVTPSSVTLDTVKITKEGEIIWMSNHARRDEINTLRLSLQIAPKKADTVTVEFHTDIADETSGYKTEETIETTEETTVTHIASDEDLCDWAIVDYEDKTGITAAEAEITLTDQDDEVLDVYIIDPNTGKGKDFWCDPPQRR